MVVSDATIVFSFIALGLITLAMVLGSYPFIMTASISSKVENHYIPHVNGQTFTYILCWTIHLLSFSIAFLCFTIGIMASHLKEKRRIEYAFKLQRLVLYSTVFIASAFLMILIFSIIYFNVIHSKLHMCEKEEQTSATCKRICTSPHSEGYSLIYCSRFAKDIEDDDPLLNMFLINLLGMCCLSIFMFNLKRLFKIYRHKLELYQILLVEFIPDKQSEMANQYQPNMEIVPEIEDEDTST